MQKISNFEDYMNEASLRDNIGVPGEEGSGGESWLDKITRSSDASARQFAMQNREDIMNFGRLIQQSMELQSGYEEALSDLTTNSIREVFGTLLDDVDLNLKIVTKSEVSQEMEETEDQTPPQFEEIVDEKILDEIAKRKILRTIQQGKALNSKAILNLSLFKNGLVDIMGRDAAAQYITVLNKISNVAQFFDWDIPEEMQAQAWKTRQGFSGSATLDFGDDEAETDVAEKVIVDLENGKDITQSEDAEELLSGVNVTVRARGIDLSVLIHESIKGIYMLVTQYSLESLSEEEAEQVIMNTDTLIDELQELKFGRQMQDVLFKQVAEHPMVLDKINDMLRYDEPDYKVTGFQEQLNFLFFGKIVEIGNRDPKEMLKIVNAILSESAEAKELCDPLIIASIKDLEQEAKYQRGETEEEGYEMEEPMEEPTLPTSRETSMSKDEISNAILDAYEKGDMEEVERLRKMLGESILFPRLKLIR